MFLISILISSLVAQALSRPQEPAAAAAQPGPTPIAIVSQNEEINPDGSFKYSYETANGIKVDQSGYLKDGTDPNSTDRIQVIEGSVSYTDNDGQVISLKYIADENGFQPEGDHLPTAPSLPSAEAQGRALPQQPSAAASVQKVAAASAPTAAAESPTPTSAATAASTPQLDTQATVSGTEPPQ